MPPFLRRVDTFEKSQRNVVSKRTVSKEDIRGICKALHLLRTGPVYLAVRVKIGFITSFYGSRNHSFETDINCTVSAFLLVTPNCGVLIFYGGNFFI